MATFLLTIACLLVCLLALAFVVGCALMLTVWALYVTEKLSGRGGQFPPACQMQPRQDYLPGRGNSPASPLAEN